MGNISDVVLEDTRILFRNFKGREGMYNREGDRNFSVILPEPLALQMSRDGWNVKWLKAKQEGDIDQPFIEVKVSYGRRPPKVVLINNLNRTRTPIGEDEIDILDEMYIESVDLIMRPYEWVVNGKAGVKAYLKSLYVTIEDDVLERKFATRFADDENN
jgi:hypothetical protein